MAMIPVAVVTGFLGSGKTTLISRMLRDPAFGRTAVIVNEFGEIGLDHDLIAKGDDTLLELTTGCLCCAVQTDLSRTLLNLMDRRAAGEAGYDRVLIETSGLADPAPILHALMTDNVLAATHEVAAVLTLVDALHGEASLGAHVEARRQVALADRLLLSKTDVATPTPSLLRRIAALNPGAPAETAAQLDSATLFAGGSVEALAPRLTKRLAQQPAFASHTPEIETVLLTRDAPIPALALTMLLQAMAEHCGTRLLRLKGLVAIEEMPGQPAVIHGVRHVVSPPVFLDRWPGAQANAPTDSRTRIVFITSGMPRHFPPRLLEAIEAEVREETVASSG